MSLRELQIAWQEDVAKTRRGGYGYCKCERPGYDRKNPDNCRICEKPYKHVYISMKRQREKK